MPYELAKKLKDAGFPQSKFRAECPCIDNSIERDGTWVCGHSRAEFITVPTLSELIEACGENFQALNRLPAPNMWTAIGHHPELETVDVFGDSAKEAAALLWLALNPKA